MLNNNTSNLTTKALKDLYYKDEANISDLLDSDRADLKQKASLSEELVAYQKEIRWIDAQLANLPFTRAELER